MKKFIKKTLIQFIILVLFTSTVFISINAEQQLSPEKNTAYQAVERNASEIAKIGDAIFYFAELGMQEFESNELCAKLLQEWGYQVQKDISGFPTALMATYGAGEPVIAIHFERFTQYDKFLRVFSSNKFSMGVPSIKTL